MKVLILAAGYGTRLYSLVKDTSKALIEINGKPLINHILERIEHLNELKEVIVVTNNKFFSSFEAWAKEQKDFHHNIRIVNDGTEKIDERLGSIGDIDCILKQKLVEDDLLVVGGDNLFDFNLEECMQFAQDKKDAPTIGLYDIHDYTNAKLFGVAALNSHNKIVSFEEKPAIPQSTLVAMCFYYFPKPTLRFIHDYLNETKQSDTAGDYIKWLALKTDVYGFKFTGKWYDIGSVESYKEAQEKFLNGK